MGNRKNRIKKLEDKSIPKIRLVYPHGYFYGEPNCEPYWTDEPIKPFAAFYEDIEKEKNGEKAYREVDK